MGPGNVDNSRAAHPEIGMMADPGQVSTRCPDDRGRAVGAKALVRLRPALLRGLQEADLGGDGAARAGVPGLAEEEAARAG